MSDANKFPRAVVTAIIFNDEGQLLLLKSDQWSDKYIIPGGKVQYGETIEDALRRETKEETNLDIERIEFLFIAEGIELKEASKKKHSIYLIHRCRARSLDVRLNEEAQSYRWVDLRDALELDLNSTSRATMERLARSGVV
jgi:nucleoside triphosphatase